MKNRDGQFYTTETVSPNREKTPEGYLLCKGVCISRVGEFEYLESDVPDVKAVGGRVKMRRTEDELFSAATMRSFEGKPVVVGHATFADPQNWSDVAIGIVSNVRRGEGDRSQQLIADLLLTKQRGIDLVESGGLREVSCGYDAQAIDDGDGKGHQVGIVGNHVALVNKARCGSTCQIKDGFMNDSMIDRLRTLFEKGDRAGFEAALAELSGEHSADEDEEMETAEEQRQPFPGEEDLPEDDDSDYEEEQEDEAPPVDSGQSLDGRIAVLEHEYQEMAQKLEKLLNAEKQEGHEELKDEEKQPDPEAEVAPDAETKEVLADADELCPGMKKPVGDCARGGFSRGALRRVKRMALKRSGHNEYGDAASLDGAALDIAFKACLNAVRATKNPKARVADGQTARAGINERNAAFWAAKR